MITYLQCRLCREGFEYEGPKLATPPKIHCPKCKRVTQTFVVQSLHRGGILFVPPPEEPEVPVEVEESIPPTKPQRPKRDRSISHHRELPMLSIEEEDRFWSFVRQKDKIECWPWRGATDHSRYGLFSLRGIQYPINRLLYFLVTGVDPERKKVYRTCNNPKCCNPAHLISQEQGHKLDTETRMILRMARQCRQIVAEYRAGKLEYEVATKRLRRLEEETFAAIPNAEPDGDITQCVAEAVDSITTLSAVKGALSNENRRSN